MNKLTARKDNIVVQKLENETLVYDLDENKAYCLNETSALVWELCDGRRKASDISNELSIKLKTLISEEFVHLALDQLSKDGLLDDGGQDYFGGMSRREVIRKVGFASFVALPVVTGITAPKAISAMSACATLDENCTPDDWRQSNCCDSLRCFLSNGTCRPCQLTGEAYTAPPQAQPDQAACDNYCATDPGAVIQVNACCSGSHGTADFDGTVCTCLCA